MTVRELCNMLEEVEDMDAQIVIFTDEEGNDVITEVDVDVFESEDDDYSDNNRFEDGTVVLIPTEFQED